jgi:hypothetical protein
MKLVESGKNPVNKLILNVFLYKIFNLKKYSNENNDKNNNFYDENNNNGEDIGAEDHEVFKDESSSGSEENDEYNIDNDE